MESYDQWRYIKKQFRKHTPQFKIQFPQLRNNILKSRQAAKRIHQLKIHSLQLSLLEDSASEINCSAF